MLDYIILFVIFSTIPLAVYRAHLGILSYIWISVMNPHRLGWGTAANYRVALYVGLAAIAGFFISSEKEKFPKQREAYLFVILGIFFTLTTCFALVPDRAWFEWNRVIKTFAIVLISLFIFQDRKKIKLLLMTISLSVGFFGLKGGLFTIITGGSHRVFGPPASFLEENNALALAELMVLPILFLLGKEENRKWLKYLFNTIAIFTIPSIIASYSRGAFLSLIFLGFVYVIYVSKKKILLIILMLIVVPISVSMIPSKYFDRMHTIKTYDEDESAMSRINAWRFAINLSADYPFLGGGFKTFQPHLFRKYAPNPNQVFDAHSIYFQVLGDHGYTGLFIFVSLLISSLASMMKLYKKKYDDENQLWIKNYAIALFLSITSYCVGGAFLSLAYFDLFYYILVAIIGLKVVEGKASRA